MLHLVLLHHVMAYTRSSVKDDWSLEPIKTILYKAESFSDAKQKLKKAEYLTDVDSSYNTDEGKKQRRENAKIHFSNDNDDEQIREKNKKKPKKTNLPSLPEPPVIITHSSEADISNKCAITATHSKASNISNKYEITAMHSKVNVSNDSSVMDTKSSSENHQKQDVILSSNNENSKKKYIFLCIINYLNKISH
ncbi:hypothetical protein ALC57_03910 [Trachymyrmex cornetzi]|uniref:Uncharacterized protein n=1 Tax=Trachymyrmex cornetzi TaxID=471704 RepID=A0A151JME4_9HYME|nr:hypothetical protein ALC57_03910 [Trachymyrmex cornetzi]